MHRREEVRRFHFDHDIKLLESVSLNSVVHLVSAVFVSIPFSTCVVLLITVSLLRHVPTAQGSRKSPVQSHLRALFLFLLFCPFSFLKNFLFFLFLFFFFLHFFWWHVSVQPQQQCSSSAAVQLIRVGALLPMPSHGSRQGHPRYTDSGKAVCGPTSSHKIHGKHGSGADVQSTNRASSVANVEKTV